MIKITHHQAVEILGPYAMPHDLARLYYGRLLWRKARTRERLLRRRRNFYSVKVAVKVGASQRGSC